MGGGDAKRRASSLGAGPRDAPAPALAEEEVACLLSWLVAGVFALALFVATVDIFWQTAEYERRIRVEHARINRLAVMRGEAPVTLAAFRQEIVDRSLRVLVVLS